MSSEYLIGELGFPGSVTMLDQRSIMVCTVGNTLEFACWHWPKKWPNTHPSMICCCWQNVGYVTTHQQSFLAHLSWKLKGDFLIGCRPSGCLSVNVFLWTFHLFIFFSRTTGTISTKLGTKYSWVKGIQVCSNEGPCPYPRGDNYKTTKIHWRNSLVVRLSACLIVNFSHFHLTGPVGIYNYM